jgi:hypothetical protein
MSTIRGDIANLYPVRQGQFKAALLKIVRDPADNDLTRREATALTRLEGLYGARTFRPFAMPAKGTQ